jgi:hypothetical protein
MAKKNDLRKQLANLEGLVGMSASEAQKTNGGVAKKKKHKTSGGFHYPWMTGAIMAKGSGGVMINTGSGALLAMPHGGTGA